MRFIHLVSHLMVAAAAACRRWSREKNAGYKSTQRQGHDNMMELNT
jgi:hypothetical protein